MKDIELRNGDALEVMGRMIEAGIVVDAIITDPPYGTTACKWDSVIPFDEMWQRLNKLIKPNGAIVLFGSEPFSSALRMSNIKNYKYDWIWEKKPTNNYRANKIGTFISDGCKNKEQIQTKTGYTKTNNHLWYAQCWSSSPNTKTSSTYGASNKNIHK
jgi:DNA modification methylase